METGDDLREATELYHIDMMDRERDMVESMLMAERAQMEMMLVDEIYEWEGKLRKSFNDFVDSLVTNDGLGAVAQAQLEKRWRTSVWERIKKGESAMEERSRSVKMKDIFPLSSIRDAWKQLLAPTPRRGSSSQYPTICLNERLDKTDFPFTYDWKAYSTYQEMGGDERSRCNQRIEKMKSRLRREVEGIEDRLQGGFKRCRGFRSSQQLAELTYSDSKWTRINPSLSRIDAQLRALKSRQNVILIQIDGRYTCTDNVMPLFAAIRSKTSCTSISWWRGAIPDKVKLPPNVLTVNLSGSPFVLSGAQRDTLEQNQLQSHRTTIEVDGWFGRGRALSFVRSFTLRFFGPPSEHLTLRLVHRSSAPGNYFIVNKDESYKHPTPCSDMLVLEDIKIWNGTQQNLSPELQVLTFVPGSRNTVRFDVFTSLGHYALRDIELLGQDGLPYQPTDSVREGEYPVLLSRAGESSSHIGPEAATKPGSL